MLFFKTRLSVSSWLASAVLCLASAVAWASPTPKDIAAAVNAGNLPQAEMMLREVLKEHPNSAKAFYELGDVLAREGHNAEARQALLRAEQIDPSLGFASSPAKFREQMDKLPAQETRPARPASGAVVAPAASPAAVYEAAPAHRSGMPTWVYILLAFGGVWLVWRIAQRLLSPPVMVLPAAGGAGVMGGGMGPGGPGGPGGSGFGPGPGYGPGYGPGGMGGGGMGLGGAALTGVVGAVAGYELAKAMEHGDRSGGNYIDNGGYTGAAGGAIPNNATPDYGSFDAGSGSNDSWDSGGGSDFGGGGGGDDSW